MEFESSKETFTVIHKDDPYGLGFNLLGIFFDPAFSMQLGLNEFKRRLHAKLRSLISIRRFYFLKQFINMYKTQIWSSAEWATPAIYHCTITQLGFIGNVQAKFLSFVGVSWIEAFLTYNVAPTRLRRSFAMLGFIFRCVYRLAPEKCCDLFELDTRRNSNLRSNSRLHNLQLVDPCGLDRTSRLSRSVWNLVAYWNHMPKDAVYSSSVKAFQKLLTEAAKDAVRQGCSFEDLCDLHFIHFRYGVETHT